MRARLIAAAVVPWLLAVACALLTPASSSAFAGAGIRPRHTGVWTSHAGPRSLRQATENVFELPPEDVVQAVAKAGPKVTVADVAAAGGISLEKAKKGLVQLAAAIGQEANLEVSKSGELVYVFPSDPQAALSAASSAAASRDAWNNAKPAIFTALRVLFGIALFASLAIIYTAIFVLSTSSSSDRDRDDRRGGYGSEGGYGYDSGGFGGGFGFGGPSLYFGPSPFDLFFYRPYYTYGGYDSYYVVEDQKPKMGILESVYSLVFGDGDPNYGREQQQLAAVASLARKNGGVLTAEQLAPLLDPPSGPQKSRDAINVDESWVLSSLTRLNGRPEVTPGGQIVYVFDDLQTTAATENKPKGAKEAKILQEKEVPFSLAEDDQLTLAGVLGAVNLLGAGYLGVQLSSLPAGIALGGFLGFVKAAYPALVAYAVGFVGAPLVRYLGLDKKNAEIQERNRLREEWLDVVNSGVADGKLAEARTYRTAMRQVGSGDSVYTTTKGAAEQAAAGDMADFDRRLGGKA